MKRNPRNDQSTRTCTFETLEERQHFSVYTVTNSVDGQPNSLRAIIQYANAHPNPDGDQLDFALGTNRGAAVLSFNPKLGALPAITDKVDIDGQTQDPALAQPVTLSGAGLTLGADRDVVNGICIKASGIGLIIKNCGGEEIDNCSFVMWGNCDGVELSNTSDNVLYNVSATGPRGGIGLLVTGNSSNNEFLNLNETNFNQGAVLGNGTVFNRFDGGTFSHNSGIGISDSGDRNEFANVSVGFNAGDGLYECGAGETLRSDNFSNNGANGIEFGLSSFVQNQTDDGNVVGNQIGSNGRNGILVDGQECLMIGETPASVQISNGDSNTIDHNVQNGIEVLADQQPVMVSGDSIYSNGGIGIDLADGSNGLANTPTISSVICNDGETTITGTEACQPGQPMTLQFFQSNPGASNEGENLLGQWVGTGTPEASNPNISTFSVTFWTGNIIEASVTATSQTTQSSAFSNAVTAGEFYLPIHLGPILKIGPHLI